MGKAKRRKLDPALLALIKQVGVRLDGKHYDVLQILGEHSFELESKGKRSWLTQNLWAPTQWCHFVSNKDGTTDTTWYTRHDIGGHFTRTK